MMRARPTCWLSVPDKPFIAGTRVAATGGGTLDVHDPATGAVIRTITDAIP